MLESDVFCNGPNQSKQTYEPEGVGREKSESIP